MISVPKVSICLPVYNGGAFLSNALESLLAQTHTDFEIIVVDDGSSDASEDIIRGFADRDKRVIFHRNEVNFGLFGNYNETMRRAQGLFIKPFAQDDILAPGAIERMVSVLESNPNVALVSCARRVVDGLGTELQLKRVFPTDRLISALDVKTFNLINLNNWVGEPATVMFRREHIGAGFDTNFYHYGDIEYWFRILNHGDLYYLSAALCDFRRHESSQTEKNLRGLYFALDMIRHSLLHRHVLADIETEEVFSARLAETIAVYQRHLDANGQSALLPMKVDFLQAELGLGAQRANFETKGYRLLSFIALQSVADLLSRLDHEKRCRADEHAIFVKEVEKMRSSLYWKLTGPLRSVRDKLIAK